MSGLWPAMGRRRHRPVSFEDGSESGHLVGAQAQQERYVIFPLIVRPRTIALLSGLAQARRVERSADGGDQQGCGQNCDWLQRNILSYVRGMMARRAMAQPIRPVVRQRRVIGDLTKGCPHRVQRA